MSNLFLYGMKTNDHVCGRPIFTWFLLVYVEVCGSKDFNYDYRRKIFDKNGHRVIFLHLYKETNKWKEHFFQYISKISNYRYDRLNRLCMKLS
jgi:hypothetical protein